MLTEFLWPELYALYLGNNAVSLATLSNEQFAKDEFGE